jgi:putative holliday junction resolvase
MSETVTARPKATRIIGIDYGLARIGLAVSDESKTIALPLATVTCEKKTEDTAKKLLLQIENHQKQQNYEVSEIVIGLPLMMSGKTGFLADEAKYFAELLRKFVPCSIVTWDERLTSVQAERSMREGNMTRKKRAQTVDNVAARIILQNYLDHLKLRNGG